MAARSKTFLRVYCAVRTAQRWSITALHTAMYRTTSARRRCGLLPSHFGHLFILRHTFATVYRLSPASIRLLMTRL